MSNQFYYNPETGEMEELDTSEKPALDIIGEKMFGAFTEAETKLLSDLSAIGINDKYKLFAFKGFALERGWKSPETMSEYLSWLIWGANREAGYVKTNASYRALMEASYNAAADFQKIYTLVTNGIQPAPCDQIMQKGAKK